MQIGIDLGGTKIEGIALDDAGTTLARQRVATPRDYAGTIAAIVSLVTGLETATGRRGTIGIGIPGAVVPDTGLVKNANSVWLIGQPLGADLAAQLRREVRLDNDANCFALSEASDGAAAGAEVVFGVIMGTGVGGGLIVRGRALGGRNLIAGEWGHNPLPWPRPDELPGPLCYCGKHGCIESWISGPAVAADHLRVTGQSLATPDIIAAAEAGHMAAQATRVRLIDRAARSLATVINLLDPDVVVLGGGLSNIPGIADDITAQLPAWVFSNDVRTPIVRHRHGDSSGVRGAAWLWPAS
ncbi:ROK family protein [Gemmatimonas sp.]|jgi:fructokinase|uniref:ROK family protein n=1 Tax=Gemmatimonas sp. TaxID=1962908 RepID=UPI0037BE9AB0